MNAILVPSIVEAIKIDLTTSNLTQKQISEKHGVTAMIVNKINVGNIHANIEPKTRSQKKREQFMERRNKTTANYYNHPHYQNTMKLELKDQDDFDKLLSFINNKPGWPKVICIDATDKESLEWAMEFLKSKQRKLELKLSKVRLMIDALERDDYSDLPPSCLKELEDMKNGIKAEIPEENQLAPIPESEQP